MRDKGYASGLEFCIQVQREVFVDDNEGIGEEGAETTLESLGLASLTYLEQDAIQMHEVFTSLTFAGFTESQALRLTAYILTEAQQSASYGVDVTFNAADDDDDDDDDSDELSDD